MRCAGNRWLGALSPRSLSTSKPHLVVGYVSKRAAADCPCFDTAAAHQLHLHMRRVCACACQHSSHLAQLPARSRWLRCALAVAACCLLLLYLPVCDCRRQHKRTLQECCWSSPLSAHTASPQPANQPSTPQPTFHQPVQLRSHVDARVEQARVTHHPRQRVVLWSCR